MTRHSYIVIQIIQLATDFVINQSNEITFLNASWNRITTQSSFKDTSNDIETFSQSTTQFQFSLRVSAALSREEKNSNDHCQSSLYNGYKLNETGQNQCFSVDKIKCREITSVNRFLSRKMSRHQHLPFLGFCFFSVMKKIRQELPFFTSSNYFPSLNYKHRTYPLNKNDHL